MSRPRLKPRNESSGRPEADPSIVEAPAENRQEPRHKIGLTNAALRYAGAVAATVIATWATSVLSPALRAAYPFAIDTVAVVLVVTLGGLGPGLLTLFLGLVAGAHFFFPAAAGLAPMDATNRAAEFLYLLAGGAILWSAAHIRAEARADVEGAHEAGDDERLEQELRRRERVQQALQDSEAKFRGFFDSSMVALDIWHADGRVLDANEAYLALTGCTREQLARGEVRWDRIIVPEHLPRHKLGLEEIARAGTCTPFETEFVRPDGRRVPVLVGGSLLPGRADRGVAFALDLTDRVRAEEALRESEERFRRIVETANEGIWQIDQHGRTVFANHRMAEMLGFTPEAMRGRTVTEFCFEEDRSLGEERIKQNLHGGREEFDFRFRRTDGSELLVLACTSPVTGQDGGVVGALGMFSDITQRKRAEEALRAADRRKDDFLAVLAHELRNPLAPVQNAVHILRARGTGDPTARWAEDVIDRQSRQLARLVDDLLDLSRIRRGRLTLQMARVDLRQPAAQAIETSRPLIQARKHTLELSIGAEPIPVHGDPARLAQVILNLLNNAAKYTPEGGQIWLGLSVEDGRAVVRVRDSGVGIEAETLARIFDLFERGNVPSTEQEGLGIGLTIVRRLVEMHGGHVTATSPGRGQGSEFVVRLPLTAEPLSHPEAPREPPAVGDAVRRRVLVVDDNQDSAESTALLLEHWGHEVEMAHDAAGALAVAAQRPFEIVLLDIGLPGMSGYELARELRAVPGLERVCLVALTGYGQEEDRRRSREAGFDHHLIKPVDWRALQRLLGECGPSDPAQAP